jgi:poly-gamma-glutamate capsule biosynthesis protein CapA/YwtB (metallophosphatase superfamily)
MAVLAAFTLLCGCSEPTEAPDTSAQGQPPQAAPAKTGNRTNYAQKKPGPVDDSGYGVARLTRSPRPPYELQPLDRVAAIANEPGSDEMTLVFVGDIMLGHAMLPQLKRHGYRYPFEGTAPLLQQADLTVGNVEGAIAERAPTTKGRWSQKMSAAPLEGLVWAGVDTVSLANNHVHDCGDDGVRETIAYLEDAGIGWFGAGDSERQAREPWIVTVRGMRVALLGGVGTGMLLRHDWLKNSQTVARRRAVILDELTHSGGAIEMGTFLHTPETLAEDVAAAKKKADLVVVSLHMGVLHYRPPYIEQIRLAEAAAKAGADLVIGHHAHFWQPVAFVDNTPVVYGIGNYTFGFANERSDESLIVRAVVSTDTRRITRVELFPLVTDNEDPRVNFNPRLLRGESARIALEDLSSWSKTLFRTPLEIREDRAVLDVAGRVARRQKPQKSGP